MLPLFIKLASNYSSSGGKDFDHLPPTQNALKHHLQRALYTAGHIWAQALQKCPAMPLLLLWGYEMKKDKLLPLWKTVPTLSKDHLSICFCKKKCKPLVDVLEEKFVAHPCARVDDLAVDTPNSDQTIVNG